MWNGALGHDSATSLRATAPLLPLPHQLLGLHPDGLGNALQALQGEVAFSSFNTTHVGAVHAQDASEGFVAETLRQPLPSQPPQQLPRITVQPLGYTHDVVQAEVALTTLDLADVGPVQLAALSQLFLGQSQLLAAQAYPPAELASDGGERRLGAETGHHHIP